MKQSKTSRILISFIMLGATIVMGGCSVSHKGASAKAHSTTQQTVKPWFAGKKQFVSQLLNSPEEHIWYYLSDDSGPAHDDIPYEALVVKNGRAVDYITSTNQDDSSKDLSIGKLSKMSQSAQIDYFKKADKQNVEAVWKNARTAQEIVDQHQLPMDVATNYANLFAKARYERPEATKIKGELTPDASGNHTAEETISWGYDQYLSTVPKDVAEQYENANFTDDLTKPLPGLSLEDSRFFLGYRTESLTTRTQSSLDFSQSIAAQIYDMEAYGVYNDGDMLVTLIPEKLFKKYANTSNIHIDKLKAKGTTTAKE